MRRSHDVPAACPCTASVGGPPAAAARCRAARSMLLSIVACMASMRAASCARSATICCSRASMRSSGESIIAAGGAPLGVPDIVLREEDVLDGVQEFGVKFIGAADEAVPVQCPVDAQTRVCESSRSGRRSASYDASTKEQNPKGGARNGCMPNASQPISAEISPVTGACHKGGARDGSPRNLFPDRWLCVLPGWQMNVNVNVNVRNLFPTESAPKKKIV